MWTDPLISTIYYTRLCLTSSFSFDKYHWNYADHFEGEMPSFDHSGKVKRELNIFMNLWLLQPRLNNQQQEQTLVPGFCCPSSVYTKTWQPFVHSEVFHFNSLKTEAIFFFEAIDFNSTSWGISLQWWTDQLQSLFDAGFDPKASVTLVIASVWL